MTKVEKEAFQEYVDAVKYLIRLGEDTLDLMENEEVYNEIECMTMHCECCLNILKEAAKKKKG